MQSGFDDLKDVYLADVTSERLRKGRQKVLNSSQVRKSLGLDHKPSFPNQKLQKILLQN